MSARALITLSLVAAGVMAPAANADAASTSRYPTIKKIAPMHVSIGETMTITGKNFLRGKAKNTVVFKRTGQRSVFVKGNGLTTTRLTVKIPAKLGEFLSTKSGAKVATKFQIRVLAKRFGKAFTPLKSSPTVAPASAGLVTPIGKNVVLSGPVPTPAATPAAATAPADCDGDGQPDATDVDDDNDLLPDTVEAKIGTDRCLADTDGDGMSDGWEYQSAIDLNARSCPQTSGLNYPTPCAAVAPGPYKRPYANPLSPDADTDYDGDSLTAGEEYAGWQHKIGEDASYRALVGPKGMWYSDGKQASVDTSPATNCVGMTVPQPFNGDMNRPEFRRADGTYPVLLDSSSNVKPEYAIYSLDRGGASHYDDGCLDDSERDEDGDFLSNFEETHGPMSRDDWWNKVYGEPLFQLTYGGTNWLDADTDGDGTVDGLDDSDFDDFLNVEEAVGRGTAVHDKNGTYTGTQSGLWVEPFNPCLPDPDARTCPTTLPAGNPSAWRPFFADMSNPASPRWPLYGTPLFDVYDPQPNWVDTNGAGNPPDQAPDISPVERWTPPVSYTQTLPPEHPLPR